MSSLKQRDVRPSGTTLGIPAGQLAALHAHAVEGYPHEVVGILAGSRAQGQVTRIVALRNERTADARKRYKVSGLVVMKAEMALEALRGLGYSDVTNLGGVDQAQALWSSMQSVPAEDAEMP